MTDKSISPLRRRFIEDMTVRGFTLATQRGYLRVVADFTAFFGRPPDQAGAEDLRRYQVGDVVGNPVRARADLGQAVAALVVEHDAEAVGQPRHHLVPDAEVGAQRIGEHQSPPFRGSEILIVQHDAVQLLEVHAPRSIALRSGCPLLGQPLSFF